MSFFLQGEGGHLILWLLVCSFVFALFSEIWFLCSPSSPFPYLFPFISDWRGIEAGENGGWWDGLFQNEPRPIFVAPSDVFQFSFYSFFFFPFFLKQIKQYFSENSKNYHVIIISQSSLSMRKFVRNLAIGVLVRLVIGVNPLEVFIFKTFVFCISLINKTKK